MKVEIGGEIITHFSSFGVKIIAKLIRGGASAPS